MVSILNYLTQGSRIFLSSWKRRIYSKKYEGDADDICRNVVENCWNGRFFQTSTGNFNQFWTRDFGWCTNSLIKLGYEKEVQQTLRYAINRFKQTNQITTTLTPNGKPFDFPTNSVDSLPWLIHSIKLSKVSYHSHKAFLNKEIRKFFSLVIDQQSGLVKPDEHFSSMKDFSIRKSSCYDNCMVGMLANDLEKMKLDNPFKKYNYSELIKRHFWSGEYFYDDLSQQKYVAGDANIFPFLCGLIKDEKMLKSVIKQIESALLDQHFPLKYTHSRDKVNFIWQEIFLRNYESDSIWMHMGPLYINLVKQVDKHKANEYKEMYKELIAKHGNFLEVFNANGKPFSTPFYYCDSGMLWAANYLTL
jgi:hypothetical protein